MSTAPDLPTLLRRELSESQARNPAYSIRALARRLGIGFGTLSMVLSGKRELSAKSAAKVLDRLDASPEVRGRILARAPNSRRAKPQLPYATAQLSADQYYVLSEWHYLAILNLIRTRGFESTPEHIAGRLGITVALARQSLDRLERTGLIRWQKDRLVRTRASLETTDGVRSAAVRRSHYQNLDRARVALDEVPVEERDFTWMTFAFRPDQLDAFRKRVREFQDRISEEFTMDSEATEVYRFATQFFPLSRREKP